ncbi:MAG TPA: alpha/beta hydrolase [Methylomirabilota bacterium]|nr:alpha/beta hydrolase [Methylomirabilota bacterium]
MTVRDDAWFEREYNPRVTVTDTSALVAAWSERSAATRAARPFLADIRTGENPREVVDVFRADGARGAVVYIHGGYFRKFSKVETSFVADGFLDAGLTVVLMNYPLCPDVALEDLIESVRRSFGRIVAEILTPEERAAVVVTGHSAGGYLTAALIATDWTARGLPARPFHGAAPISGVFDLAPLLRTTMNGEIRLSADRAPALDLIGAPQRVHVPVVAAVGGAETAEFHRQSDDFAAAWTAPRPSVLRVPGANHFTVLDSLATPGASLNAAVVDMALAAAG